MLFIFFFKPFRVLAWVTLPTLMRFRAWQRGGLSGRAFRHFVHKKMQDKPVQVQLPAALGFALGAGRFVSGHSLPWDSGNAGWGKLRDRSNPPGGCGIVVSKLADLTTEPR
jgi:hypothetical protein